MSWGAGGDFFDFLSEKSSWRGQLTVHKICTCKGDKGAANSAPAPSRASLSSAQPSIIEKIHTSTCTVYNRPKKNIAHHSKPPRSGLSGCWTVTRHPTVRRDRDARTRSPIAAPSHAPRRRRTTRNETLSALLRLRARRHKTKQKRKKANVVRDVWSRRHPP